MIDFLLNVILVQEAHWCANTLKYLWRYCDAAGWERVAEAVGYSSRQCQRLVEQGLDAVDFFGADNCMGGAGVAEG